MCQKVNKFAGTATRLNSVRYTLYILMAFGFITPSIAECNIMQWWTDPCNVNPMLMEKLRHGRSVERQSLVVEQLKRSINMNRKLLKEIEKIYTNGTESGKHHQHRQNFEWLNATQMVQRLKSFPKFKKKLRKLHPYLQRFAGTLEVLSCTPIESHGHFNKIKRDQIFQDAKLYLRGLICEVHDAIPSKFRRKVELSKMHIKLPKTMNLTDSYTYDQQFLRNLKWFLNQLKNKVLRLKKERRRKNNHVVRVHNT